MTLTPRNIRFTASGVEVPAVTAEQMREVDRVAMQETGPNLFQMMENAGRNLAALSMELLGNGWQQASYLALAGSEAEYPGLLERLLTHPVRGLDNRKDLIETPNNANAIKVFCEVAPQ